MPAYDKLAFFVSEMSVFVRWHSFCLKARRKNLKINN